MIELFSLDALNRSASTFNTDKLNWLNQQYLMNLPLDDIVALVKQRLERVGTEYDPDLDLGAIVDLYRPRVTTINQLVDSIDYCFRDFDSYDDKAATKALGAASLEPLEASLAQLEAVENWDKVSLHGAIEVVVEKLGVGMGKVGQPLRVAITGGSFSPPIDQTLELLGRGRSLARIERAIAWVRGASGG